MADTEKATKPKLGEKGADKPICGIIMPIAGDNEYTADHWRRVQRIIERSIAKADMTVRLVWESPEVDVIHARILQGIYESDVVICDVSGLNPNVMLELGLRLSTKRPTIVITDNEKKPPFDIGVFQYHSYQRDLEYNSVDGFIDEISKKIRHVFDAYEQKRYKSFVENFTFEVVEPTEVSVPADVAIRDRMEAFARQLSRIEKTIGSAPSQPQTFDLRGIISLSFETLATDPYVKMIINELTKNKKVLGVRADLIGAKTMLRVAIAGNIDPAEMPPLRAWIQAVIEKHDDVLF